MIYQGLSNNKKGATSIGSSAFLCAIQRLLYYFLHAEHAGFAQLGHVTHPGFTHDGHTFGTHQLLTQPANDWKKPPGHDGHVTHGFGHGVAQRVPHFMQEPEPEVEVDSAANAGTANITATTATNTNTTILFIVIPPFGYDDYNSTESIHPNMQIGK